MQTEVFIQLLNEELYTDIWINYRIGRHITRNTKKMGCVLYAGHKNMYTEYKQNPKKKSGTRHAPWFKISESTGVHLKLMRDK